VSGMLHRGIVAALLLSVALHLALFLSARTRGNHGMGAVQAAPATTYLAAYAGMRDTQGLEGRMINSPLVFSLPTPVGFSQVLGEGDVRTRLTFTKPSRTERFLAVDPAQADADGSFAPDSLMLSGGVGNGPGLPGSGVPVAERRPAAARVVLSAGLKERLVGGVVLPPSLNQETPKPWEVRATITVTGDGMVGHVFLDQPLESAALNMQVLQLLRGLRFKSGGPAEGVVEILSPEPAAAGRTAP